MTIPPNPSRDGWYWLTQRDGDPACVQWRARTQTWRYDGRDLDARAMALLGWRMWEEARMPKGRVR